MADNAMPDSGFRQVGRIPEKDGRPETVVLSRSGAGGMLDKIGAPATRNAVDENT
jgi:hypothetical protein